MTARPVTTPKPPRTPGPGSSPPSPRRERPGRARSGRGGRFGLGAEAADGVGGVAGTVDGVSGDEDVGTGLGAAFYGLGADAAVHLQPDRQVAAPDQLAGTAYLRQHHVEELLAAEAGLHG